MRAKWSGLLGPDSVRQITAINEEARLRPGWMRNPTAGERQETAQLAVKYAIEKLEATCSAWRERQFLSMALHHSWGGCTLDDIHTAAKESTLISRDVGGVTYCTTEKVMLEERSMLEFVASHRGTCRPLVPVLIRPPGSKLSDEQWAALSVVLGSQDRVVALQGRAGTGKSTMLQTAEALITLSGQSLVTIAPTTKACQVLQEDGFQPVTLQKMLMSPAQQERLRNAVVWLDEAGLAGTRDLKELFDLAEQYNARLVLSGDIAQHNAVARGDGLRLLVQHGDLQCATVTTIRRQRGDAYRSAIHDLSEANANPELGVRALESLDQLGWVREVADEDRYVHLATDVVDKIASGVSVQVVAPTHREIDAATLAIRGKLIAMGKLGEEAHPVMRLTSSNLTTADLGTWTSYRHGQVVEFLSDCAGVGDDVGFKGGERVLVLGPLGERILVRRANGATQWLPIDQPSKFVLYDRDRFEVRVGDRIRVTKKLVYVEGDVQRGLPNGSIHTVTAVAENGDLSVDNGAVIKAKWGHVTHGWACTSIAAQGTTVDHVFVVQSAASGRAATMEQLYVSLSRGRDKATIYTDSKETLFAAAGRSSRRVLATELLMSASLPTAEYGRRWRAVQEPPEPLEPRVYSTSPEVPVMSHPSEQEAPEAPDVAIQPLQNARPAVSLDI